MLSQGVDAHAVCTTRWSSGDLFYRRGRGGEHLIFSPKNGFGGAARRGAHRTMLPGTTSLVLAATAVKIRKTANERSRVACSPFLRLILMDRVLARLHRELQRSLAV